MALSQVGSFSNIPIEIHREIALHCGNDRDLAKYGILCQDTHNAIHGHGGIWRARFLERFDYPFKGDEGLTSKECEEEYKSRTEIIAKTVNWSGYSVKNMVTLLITLIREAYNSAPGPKTSIPVTEAKNMKPIFELVRKLDILNNFGNFAPGQVLNADLARNAVQLLLFPWTLDRSFIVWGYEASRRAAFSQLGEERLYDPETFEINDSYLLHVGNFFAKHCSANPGTEGNLRNLYEELEEWSKPKLWTRVLKQGVQPIGRAWKGMTGEMANKDLKALWKGRNFRKREQCPERLTQQAFDDYDLEMSDRTNASTPTLSTFLEDMLCSLPPMELFQGVANADPKLHSLPFHGRGTDGDQRVMFEVVGNIYALPEQAGIPGWQHISFMKFCPRSDGREKNFAWTKYESFDDFQEEDIELWAYEGIMIPGNNVIIGRWFAADGPRPGVDEVCLYETGPSLLWCTDETEADQETKLRVEESYREIEVIHNPIFPEPETLPAPIPVLRIDELDVLPGKQREESKKSEKIRALVPENMNLDGMGFPPPSPPRDFEFRKPFWHLTFRREERLEKTTNSDCCISLAPDDLNTQIRGLPSPRISSFTAQEQYYQMMDLVAEDNVFRTGPRLVDVPEEIPGEEIEPLTNQKEPSASEEDSPYETDLELMKQKIARTDGFADKAALTIKLLQRAKATEMIENVFKPELAFLESFLPTLGGPAAAGPLYQRTDIRFRQQLRKAKQEVKKEWVRVFFDGNYNEWREARWRVERPERVAKQLAQEAELKAEQLAREEDLRRRTKMPFNIENLRKWQAAKEREGWEMEQT